MPTYHFRCPKGHDFDRFFKTISTAPSEQSCPECGAPASRQMSGGAGLHFKGSGFYLTDYGKNAHRGTAPAKSDSATGGSAPSETSAKPAPAAEAPKPKAESPKAESPKPKRKSE